MQIYLPDELNKYDKIVYEPFCIFEKNNFLENSLYQKLKENFPEEKEFVGIHKNGKKIFLNNKQDEFYKFIKNNIWGEFYNQFNSKDLLNSLIQTIKPELKKIKNRSNFKNYYFNKKYTKSFYNRLYKKILKIINYNSIRLGFEFSIIKKDCFIPPHCDTENKLLSLMIYFPLDGKEYENLGTNFYSKKEGSKLNFDTWESKYLDKEKFKAFYDNYEIFYKSKFEENKLVGFIKNEKSWHDVSEFQKNLIRKSLNINLYIE